MKKLFSAVLLLALLIMSVLPVSAAPSKGILVMGDSIATGYGLNGYKGARPGEAADSFGAKLAAEYGLDLTVDLMGVTNVGASVSADLRTAAIIATLIAILLMLVYISFRFEILSGLTAVICLAHDIFVMFAVYSLLQIPLNSTMIAALLTILGYSINATIIVFDRIRENVKLNSKDKFEENVDRSIKQTLTRSLNTTLTTLFTIGMVYILGVDSIKQFALPIIVGIFAGLFSSVCLAGNIWAILKKAFNKKRV